MLETLRWTRWVAAAVVIGVVCALPTNAAAQIAPVSVDGNDSNGGANGSHQLRARLVVAPYGWMTGISGETGVRDLSADVDVPFSTLLSHLRFAAMAAFEGEYGPWLGVADLVYASVRDDQTRSLGPFEAELRMTMKMLVTQAFAAYSFLAAPTMAIDLLAGGRLWSVDASLKRSGPIDTVTRSRDPAWADALGGLRVRWRAAERWHVSAAGDVGGGGSKVTRGASGTVAYDISTRWSLFGSYRYLYLDYRKNDFFFKGPLKGPALGGAYRW